MSDKNEKSISIWKGIAITVGIILCLLTAAMIVYRVFKKYFKITLECGDCEFSDGDGFIEDIDYEPECCVYDSCCDDIEDDIADALADAE